ncbi:hypothetical protein PP182_04360 [Maribacter sp. PR1]|uniref:DUF6730 family protein n=1 Tax=Maribacter cobaltidurans TaxID=1178778 RepID=A0ABU7IQP7_9FLAO|nr:MULTISPECIES: DUF6730 family protein [Maribacter]MDC6387898.1 hypothetical protein [Maribacter sp. PR1]MEE1975287.1 DUF6730 family protein [Maribacter cobaltidurans]
MAKLDEIAELLTEEINGFEKSIGRLERVHENLRNLPLKPDTTEINALLKKCGNNQRRMVEEQLRLMQRILHKVERSIMLPSWAIKFLWGLLVSVLLVLGFSVFQLSRLSKKEEAAFGKGRDSTMGHFERFFDESPQVKELYLKWREENGKK